MQRSLQRGQFHVVGTVSRRIDPEQTELEKDSIPRPATQPPEKFS